MRLFNKFGKGLALRLIKASWLNKVADYWNYARGGHFINWIIPDNPTQENGPRVDLDIDALDGALAGRGFLKEDTTAGVARDVLPGDDVAPEDWNTENDDGYGDAQTRTVGQRTITTYGACGTSKKPASADHRHKSNLAPLGDDSTYGGCVLEGWTNGTSEGTTGTLKYAARADHTHPGVSADDVPYDSQYTVADVLEEIIDPTDGLLVQLDDAIDGLEQRVSTLEGASGNCSCQSNWDAYDTWADTVDDDLHELSDILGDITTTVNGATKVPLSALTGNLNGHSGTCYVTIENDGTLGHSGNTAFSFLDAAAQVSGATKLMTDADQIDVDNVDYDGVNSVGDVLDDILDPSTGCVMLDAIEPLTASSLVGTDSNGTLDAILALPTTNVASDKVLTVRSGGTALSWGDAVVAPATADTSTDRMPIVAKNGTAVSWVDRFPTTPASANTIGGSNTQTSGNGFTAGSGVAAVKVWLPTRMYKNNLTVGTWWREFTITDDGRIQAIGGEQSGQSLYAATT